MQSQDISSLLSGKVWPGMPPGMKLSDFLDSVHGKALPISDKVDLASFDPSQLGASGYGKTMVYEEEISAFMAQGSLAYKGEDGSKVFIDFSYQTMTRKVHYEVTQAVSMMDEDQDDYDHPVHDSFGPRATAGRIVQFAKGLVKKFRAMEGNDPEKLEAFIRKLVDAIRRGFFGLDEILANSPQSVSNIVRDTFDRAMDGMAALEREIPGAQQPTQRIMYDQEITYTQASVEISIMA